MIDRPHGRRPYRHRLDPASLEVFVDLFNVFDKQTGYNPDPFLMGVAIGAATCWQFHATCAIVTPEYQ